MGTEPHAGWCSSPFPAEAEGPPSCRHRCAGCRDPGPLSGGFGFQQWPPPALHSCLPRGLPAASPAAGLPGSPPTLPPRSPSPLDKAGLAAPLMGSEGSGGVGEANPPPAPITTSFTPEASRFAEPEVRSGASLQSTWGVMLQILGVPPTTPALPPLPADPAGKTASTFIPDVVFHVPDGEHSWAPPACAGTDTTPPPQFPHVHISLQPHWGPIRTHGKPRY